LKPLFVGYITWKHAELYNFACRKLKTEIKMKKLFLTACVALTCQLMPFNACAKRTVAPIHTEQDLAAYVSKMTIEEKVGQMTELVIDVIGHWENGTFMLDNDKLERVFIKYKVGSILNAPGPVAQTPEWWQKTIRTINDYSIRGCGIPCVYGLDQNHGTTYTLGGTLFPQNINLGASFNPELARQAAAITAYETRAANCPWTYSPTVDLSRDPRWSRVWENFGEDCLVNAVMGKAMVEGFQGKDARRIDRYHIGTSVKHYMAYGVARTGKDRTPSYVPEHELREKHFAPFKACVEAGATSVMVNSGSVNGTPMHVSAKYLTKWLKEETDWDGMLVTDWADIDNLWKREMVAADKKEAICMAINAGIDMAMEPYDLSFCDLLAELVREGRISMERIDDAVCRVLRMKMRMGLFEQPNTDMKDYPDYGSAKHSKAALDAAVETMVLLKNKDGILPLNLKPQTSNLKPKHILVTGPNANSMRCLNGGWSYTWQGKDADKYAADKNTILEAMQQRFGRENVVYEAGVTYRHEGKYWEENTPQIERAVAAAAGADVIVACVGENSYAETPGNLDDLALSSNQRQLVRKLAATGKPVVLIVNGGRPRLISDIEPLCAAVIDILLPGNEGGNALARLLAGDENFSARMPYTYPRHPAALTTYDYRVSEQSGTMEGVYDYNAQVDVQWPFGFGLSYTTFAYSNLRVDKSVFHDGDVLKLTVDVQNTGNRAGKESVLLFSRDVVASIVPESRRLRAFQKIFLQPGEQKTVSFTLPARDLAFVGADGAWHLEPGLFRLQIGTQMVEITKE
jgi:beta-glucosidase